MKHLVLLFCTALLYAAELSVAHVVSHQVQEQYAAARAHVLDMPFSSIDCSSTLFTCLWSECKTPRPIMELIELEQQMRPDRRPSAAQRCAICLLTYNIHRGSVESVGQAAGQLCLIGGIFGMSLHWLQSIGSVYIKPCGSFLQSMLLNDTGVVTLATCRPGWPFYKAVECGSQACLACAFPDYELLQAQEILVRNPDSSEVDLNLILPTGHPSVM